MLGRRPDAKLVREAPNLRRFLPIISPRRGDALVYLSTQIDVEASLRFLRERNSGLPRDRRMTLFHLILRAMATVLHSRPGLNRFAAGGRLWERDEVWITFSAKRRLTDGSPLLTVKRKFPEAESSEEMVQGVTEALETRRQGGNLLSDREIALALRLPRFVGRGAVRFLQAANSLGLLPRSFIDDDPLFTSLFVANLGSVGLDAAYHHLWEYGTCSIFAVIGRVHRNGDGKRCVEIKYTFDERIEDGLYAAVSLRKVRQGLEHPERLV